MKKCFKCGIEKPLTEFYKHLGMADGHLGKCKECTKKDAINRYNVLIGDPNWYIKERTRGREKFHRLYKHNHSKETPEQSKKRLQNFRKNHPEKNRAVGILNNAVRDKKISKLPCEVCGEIKVQAHHEDYSKPLDVNWLCIKHHNERHVQIREEKLLKKFA